MRLLKYWMALFIRRRMMGVLKDKTKYGQIDEDFRKKWAIIQGLILSRGRTRWNWGKIWPRK